MTVSPNQSDHDGALLQANITALTTQISVTSSPLHKAAMSAQLDQLQHELVYHYLDTRRLLASSILSTMT